jgi:4-amino-4-deoxy-L-arabinose transferase-like glycosyltransferase
MRRLSAAQSFILAAAAVTLYRLLAAWAANLELAPDEAQYYGWSLAPDWGYYSKPPVVAWLIRLTTTLFGDGEHGVRAAAYALYPATAIVVFLLARRLFDERTAFWSGLAYLTLPVVFYGARFITTDAPLHFFWALSLFFFVRALEKNLPRHWLALGIGLGLGLMSKYTMALFPLCALLALLATPRHRVLLGQPMPWLALLLALAIFSPNVAWNLNHDLASYRHTAEISQLERSLLHPEALLEFFAAQFGVFGPLLMASFLWIAARPRTVTDEHAHLLAWFSVPVLLIFLSLSLASRAFANWASFAYIAATPWVVHVWLDAGKRKTLAAALLLNVALGLAMYHYHGLARITGLPLNEKTDIYKRITGWRSLGTQVANLQRAFPRTRIVGADRKLLAELIYYARPHAQPPLYYNPSRQLNNHYALFADIADSPNGTFLLISRQQVLPELNRQFATVRPLSPIAIPMYGGNHVLRYHVWLLTDFRGYR